MAKSLTTVTGIHAVEAVLKNAADSVEAIYFRQGRLNHRLESIHSLAKSRHIHIELVDEKVLDQLAESSRHQGVVAQYRASKQYNENDLFTLLEGLDKPAFLLILDGVTDPHNLGACLRTADAVGVDAVITPRDQAVGLTPVVRKTASGAAETIPFVQVTNLGRTIDKLKQLGIWITGTSDRASQSLYQQDFTGSVAIVMGAEGKGLRRMIMERCDFLVSIPMQGQVESLNISVATGVTLYEALRQRTD